MKRGEIYYADLSPVIGCEQGGLRPALIYLVPIQMGHQDAEEFLMITRDEFNEYGRWEDEQVPMVEMSMG